MAPSSHTHDSVLVKTNSTCIFTISSWNNYGFVRTFLHRVERQHPEITCLAWFVADNPEPYDLEIKSKIDERILSVFPSNWHLITLNDLQKVVDYSLETLAMRFDLVCFNTAVKPYVFQYLMKELKAEKVLYFDNDIFINRRLDTILAYLDDYDFVLTPHIVEPYPDDGKNQNEMNIMQAGQFNFGFLGLREGPNADKYLSWWGERLRYYGFVDVAHGMHFDQNWGDFIPSYFDVGTYKVIRDPKYNIAYWNLHYTGKHLWLRDDQVIMYDDEPAVFMHFSGMSDLRRYNKYQISKHQNRYSLSDFPKLSPILDLYLSMLISNDAMAWRDIGYGYNTFDNRIAVLEAMKNLYILQSNPHNMDRSALLFRNFVYENPFITYNPDTINDNVVAKFEAKKNLEAEFARDPADIEHTDRLSFLEWLIEGSHEYVILPEGEYAFPEIGYRLYLEREDVREFYPDIVGKDTLGIIGWMYGSGFKEGGCDDALIKILKDNYDYELNKPTTPLLHDKRGNFAVNLAGWLRGLFGVAESSRLVYRSLVSQNIDVAANLLPGATEHLHTDTSVPLSRTGPYNINIIVANAVNTLEVKRGYLKTKWKELYNIGYWAWELDSFPSEYIAFLSSFSEIWTPSKFVTDAILTSPGYDGTPIRTMPFGKNVDMTIYEPDREHFGFHENQYVFLVVFDFYSCIYRKNPIGAIRAFKEAFSPEDHSVLLLIKSMNGNRNKEFAEQEAKMIKETIGHENIAFINHHLSGDLMNKLKGSIDCYVSLHRSEGYGLNVLEMLMMNKPIIATGYSGTMEFMEPVEELLGESSVPYKLREVGVNWGPYKKDKLWGDPDISAAAITVNDTKYKIAKNG